MAICSPWPSDPALQIDCLRKEIEALSTAMEGLERSSERALDKIGDTGNLLQDAYGSLTKITTESGKFVTNLSAQYKWAEKLAEVSKQTAVNIGLAVGRSGEFTKVFNKAASQVQKFGGNAQDVSNIMERFVNESGRARIITEDEVLNIYLLEKGLGVADESAAELLERMDLMGMNATEANQAIKDMVIDSQKLGLNAGKVAKSLSDNFEKMQTYSFVGGVKGMTKMAQLAVKMRTDVSSMLGMADKFYEPEGAIEAVANLQMLGGDVAAAFGDPFEIMYLARNKPEELAERVQDMTENMLQFNEETKQYELPAEGRMQLKAMGEQLGFNVDQMVDIARQSSKIKDIKMDVSGNILDEDTREGIASLARMDKSGNWVVDFAGDEIPIGDIDSLDEAAKILAAPATTDDAIMDMAYNSMTTNDILENILKAIKTGYVASNNIYEGVENAMRPTIESTFKGVEKNIEKMLQYAGDAQAGEVMKKMQDVITAGGVDLGTLTEDLFNALPGIVSNALTDPAFIEAITTGLPPEVVELLQTPVVGGEIDPDDEVLVGGELPHDFIWRPGDGLRKFHEGDTILSGLDDGPLFSELGISRNAGVAKGSGGSTKIEVKINDFNVGGSFTHNYEGNVEQVEMSKKTKKEVHDMIEARVSGAIHNGNASGKQYADKLAYEG